MREACGLSSHEAKSESPVHLLYSPREQVASLLHVGRPSQTDSYHHKHHKQRHRQLFPWWHSFSWTRRGSIGSHSTVCISKDATVCPGEAIKCGHNNPTTSGGPVEASCRWHQPPLSFLIPRDGELGQSPNARGHLPDKKHSSPFSSRQCPSVNSPSSSCRSPSVDIFQESRPRVVPVRPMRAE